MKYIVKQKIITFVISGLAVQIRPWAPENKKGANRISPFLISFQRVVNSYFKG